MDSKFNQGVYTTGSAVPILYPNACFFLKKGIYNYFFQSFLLELHSRVQLYFVLFQLF